MVGILGAIGNLGGSRCVAPLVGVGELEKVGEDWASVLVVFVLVGLLVLMFCSNFGLFGCCFEFP